MMIQTYLVDAEVPFLCRKQTLESWNFRIEGRDKISEIKQKTDGSRKKIKMIDTTGEHYAIILETKRRQDSSVLLLEDADSSVLFLEDAEGGLCSFKAVRKVQEINRHKRKE